MARPHDAHLTGIFASYMLPRYFYDEGGMWVRALDLVKELNTKGRMAVQAAFSEATAQAGVAASWRQGEDMPAECVVRHARHSDVLILGQENAGDVEAATGNDFVEQVLLSAGRPVIVLPTAGSFRNAGARVLYCWNQSRESARAIADAAPLLRGASALRAPTLGHGAPADPDLRASFRRPGRLLRQPRLSPAGVGVPRRTRSRHRRRHPERGRRFRRGPDRHGGIRTQPHAPMDHGRRHALAVGGDDLAGVFLTRRRRADAGKEAAVVGLHNAER